MELLICSQTSTVQLLICSQTSTVQLLICSQTSTVDKWFYPTFYKGCDYLNMLGLNLFHVSKWGPRSHYDSQRRNADTKIWTLKLQSFNHWNGHYFDEIFITVPEVVKMKTSGAASDKNFITWQLSCFCDWLVCGQNINSGTYCTTVWSHYSVKIQEKA